MKLNTEELLKHGREIWSRCKYPLLILMLGICLMVMPLGPKEDAEMQEEPESIRELEEDMAQLLQHVEGAGEVRVMLSQQTGPMTEYLQDSTVCAEEAQTQHTARTVLLMVDGNETAIAIQTTCPTYLGAVIVAEGADRPTVKLNLIRAVSSLTGLDSSHITVIKMKH